MADSHKKYLHLLSRHLKTQPLPLYLKVIGAGSSGWVPESWERWTSGPVERSGPCPSCSVCRDPQSNWHAKVVASCPRKESPLMMTTLGAPSHSQEFWVGIIFKAIFSPFFSVFCNLYFVIKIREERKYFFFPPTFYGNYNEILIFIMTIKVHYGLLKCIN